MRKQGIGDAEWLRRLRAYAQGNFHFSVGQRPPKNSKWAKHVVNIDKCPRKSGLSRDVFGRALTCTCGYHPVEAPQRTPSVTRPVPNQERTTIIIQERRKNYFNVKPLAPNLKACRRYFSSKFFLWMPRRKWQIPLYCTNCSKKSLTAKGLYNRLRTVIDVDCFYFIGAEYLECRTCRKCYISWSKEVMDQLDLGHAMQFPATLTHRGACDSKVVTLLRARTLGNSSTALHHNIEELHSEAWLRRTLLYLTDCETHSRSIARFAQPLIYQPPLPFPGLPNYRRLMSGYVADVYRRLTELKAQVTSTYGSILKLDSTKKIIKKMAGKFAGSASWVANVGNERGEVLMSVLTASEGQGLKAMAQGLVKRYRDADEAPPSAIYVDRDCCCLAEDRQLLISAIFAPWQSTIRLDIWHFIRRFSVGCSTDSHALILVSCVILNVL
ncbi:hypothetical protein CAPTEDRAFT_185707 [Capitella teleta]|uniref:DUF6729 domain-containing protein n=1 Tax=Capitella teleta TaxID=283909 RepID=R7UXK7_CAPTE|nr:hypothetical protein CAPTEDRAFT_185707 [Capitella teleta]|eukprot:ELU11022.1 hypothetical protein CAPTEDRAFT_185707 [Capitella teleta]